MHKHPDNQGSQDRALPIAARRGNTLIDLGNCWTTAWEVGLIRTLFLSIGFRPAKQITRETSSFYHGKLFYDLGCDIAVARG